MNQPPRIKPWSTRKKVALVVAVCIIAVLALVGSRLEDDPYEGTAARPVPTARNVTTPSRTECPSPAEAAYQGRVGSLFTDLGYAFDGLADTINVPRLRDVYLDEIEDTGKTLRDLDGPASMDSIEETVQQAGRSLVRATQALRIGSADVADRNLANATTSMELAALRLLRFCD